MVLNCIGIDVSKASINVHIPKNNKDLVLENSVKSFRSLFSKLKKIYKKQIENIIFIFEPTGSYSEALRKYCSQQKIKCFILKTTEKKNSAKISIKNEGGFASLANTLNHNSNIQS